MRSGFLNYKPPLLEYSTLTQSISLNATSLLSLVVLCLPFLSFVMLLLSARRNRAQFAWAGIGLLLLATLISVWIFSQVWAGDPAHSRTLWFEMPIGDIPYRFTIGVLVNELSALMLVVVCFVSFWVHLYSVEYMRGDAGYLRYFAFLGLFTFSMLGIVLMDNLLFIFMFWELVGVSSYALIGFWHQKSEASYAAKKAFIVNRIGDLGFLIALGVLWTHFGTLDLEAISSLMSISSVDGRGEWISFLNFEQGAVTRSMSAIWLTVAGVGLFCGAVGKSAQFPLQVWLPDAMQGPTPVSALIHAATMVAAGVFLLARVFPLLSMDVLTLIAIAGAITAFMGAVAAIAQHDIKKVLAFSTISQLGYMVMGMGVGAYSAAIFHLLTHAAFKACLFLGAGMVIHAMHEAGHAVKAKNDFDPQDMRYMGGLRKKLPITFISFMVAGGALAGFPFFSGFLSKDAILTGTIAWTALFSKGQLSFHVLIPTLGFVAALLTPFYIGRQILLIFFGEFRLPHYLHIPILSHFKEPRLMKIPLLVLSALSLWFFYAFNPLDGSGGWLMQSLRVPVSVVPVNMDVYMVIQETWHDWHTVTAFLSMSLVVAGFGFAFLMYRPEGRYAQNYLEIDTIPHSIFTKISRHNWYLDNLYDFLIVRGVHALSVACAWFDHKIVDGIVNVIGVFNVIVAKLTGWFDRTFVDGLVRLAAYATMQLGSAIRFNRSGKIQTYFIWTLVGVLIFIIWFSLY